MNKPILTFRSDGLADLTFTLNMAAITAALSDKANALTRKGVYGRPPKLSPQRFAELVRLIEEGSHTQKQLAAMFDLTQPAISKIKQKHISLEV